MNKLAGTTSERVWPVEDFYWAIIDASGVPPRGAARHEQLMYRLEDCMPVDAEAVHAVFRSVDRTRVLAIAIDRDRLADASAGGAEVVRPAALPDFVREAIPATSDHEIFLSDVNLLSGPCEPSQVRAWRRRVAWTVCSGMAAIVTFVGIGALRRAAVLDAAASASRARADATILKALDGGGGAGGLPPSLQLVSELRRLEAAESSQRGKATADVAMDLAALLAAWPGSTALRVDGLQISQDTASIRWRSASAVDVQGVVDALSGLPGWSADQPQLRTDGGDTQASLVLRRVRGGTS